MLTFLLSLAYSLYDKPLFNQTSSSIYKFRGNQDSDILGTTDAEELEKSIRQDKFGIARKGFSGTEGGGEGSAGPVEFEKETIGGSRASAQEDVFGLDTFLNKAKQGKRKASELDDEEVDRKGKKRA